MRLSDNEWRNLSKALGFPVRMTYKDFQGLSKKQEGILLGWFYQQVELPEYDF